MTVQHMVPTPPPLPLPVLVPEKLNPSLSHRTAIVPNLVRTAPAHKNVLMKMQDMPGQM